MQHYTIREVNSEILIFLDYNHPTRVAALKAAVRLLQQEVLREEHNLNGPDIQQLDRNGISKRSEPNG